MQRLGALLFTVALHAGFVAIVCSAIVRGFDALGWNALGRRSATAVFPLGALVAARLPPASVR